MASSNNSSTAAAASNTPASAFDDLLIQGLMSRLQLRPPFLDTNSFLSHSLDDFLLNDQLPEDDDDEEDDDNDDDDDEIDETDGKTRRLLAREEAKLEKEIIRIVQSGNGVEALKANSGQSVAIGDHNICVGTHEEAESDYRVWEWHGHVMLFDEESGYSAEYIYGNYFERLPAKNNKKKNRGKEAADVESEEEETKVKRAADSGLRDLIGGGSKDPVAGVGGGRVLHRNCLNSGSF